MEDSEDLSDEQIQILLQNAESRLRLREKETSSSNSSDSPSFKFPQLSTGEIAKSHVRPAKHGATVLRQQSEGKNDKESSNLRMRKVEDPVQVRQQKLEVGNRILYIMHMLGGKFIPILLDADLRHRLGCCPAPAESFIFHSYSELSSNHTTCHRRILLPCARAD